ncbi:hypothetical protein SD70_30340 [Gordoniibacillus kamchatkensis]|uniref:HTH araC/xylS-type domain-containing protein n=1 Tax=Gordoniibacillus kamchatkensis TaxID=1590651 RepID=A0ABR5AA22_9BACL|nr:AraC family transcriptional regulator [Paenibacillus sp. VKM B-2647]KIL37836.1 hypothetical protein SD70_30340 [Paenibacillus sp. VKM B-2647]
METVIAVQRAIDYMEEHLGERIEPQRIAEAAYMSLPNLYRMFYALTGHPLVEYVRKRRIHRAAVSLRHSDAPVLDIAFDCGFDSYRTFAAAFKRFTGLTPGAYRKAGTYYSFERVNLPEKVSYAEDRALSRQYPDVKVIRTLPERAVAYRHAAFAREGLEDEAFRLFYELLAAAGFDMEKTRIFGSDVPPEPGSRPNLLEYVVMAPIEPHDAAIHPKLFTTALPEGLYAVCTAPAGPAEAIVAEWNRLLAEWLPRSSFKLGGHMFMEQYCHHRGKTTRLKLFLPVVRKHEQEPIEIAQLAPVRMLAFRAAGDTAQSAADERLTGWLTDNGITGGGDRSLFMCYSYGFGNGSDRWYELGVSLLPDEELSAPHGGQIKWMEGGLYACVTTEAYGAMTGVLDRLHEWLGRSGEYRMDEARSWLAKYEVGAGPDVERSTRVTCCLPISVREPG